MDPAQPSPQPMQPAPPGQTEALLAQLEDIGVPEPAAWFPPAPGWWGLALLVATALFFLYRFLRSRWAANRHRKEAAALLEAQYGKWQEDADAQAYASAVHQLVRRVAIHHSGRSSVARLTGAAFIDAVNALSMQPLSSSVGEALSQASYRRAADIDVDSVQQAVEAWLSGLERPRRA